MTENLQYMNNVRTKIRKDEAYTSLGLICTIYGQICVNMNI